jgi:hypothetical protein
MHVGKWAFRERKVRSVEHLDASVLVLVERSDDRRGRAWLAAFSRSRDGFSMATLDVLWAS